MKRAIALILLLSASVLLVSCGGSNSAHPSYQENKKMVLDMLKTDDGKKTVKELLEDKEMRNALVFDEPVITKTILDTFHSEQGKKLWSELIQDPGFADKLAKTMQQENEQLLKKMMKDPDYQGMMMDVLKAPHMQQEYLSLLRTKSFREQIKRDMQEMIASPAFKKVVTDTLQEIMKKQSEKQ